MREVHIGDFILGQGNELFCITNIEIFAKHVTYTIKSLKSRVEFLESYSYKYYREIQGLSYTELSHIGKIIPRETSMSTLKLLYSNIDT